MSQWSCSWCLVENSCTSNTSTCSQRKIIGEAVSYYTKQCRRQRYRVFIFVYLINTKILVYCKCSILQCFLFCYVFQSSEVSLIKGRQHCPSFHLEDRLLIPHEAKQELAIQVKNLLAPVTVRRLKSSRDGYWTLNKLYQHIIMVVNIILLVLSWYSSCRSQLLPTQK